MVLKIDFHKAYDSVNWGFLMVMLRKSGCGSKWCSWIKECISTVQLSILINGSPTDEFRTHRGLR